MTTWPQRLRLVLVSLALGGTVWLGVKEGLDGLRDAEGGGQRVAAVFQILYGLAAIMCLIALFARPRWARGAFGAWAFALTMTAGLAPVVWGGTAWWTGVLSGAIALLVAALVCWGGLAHARMVAKVTLGLR
jgi:hypothetical protein